MINQKKITKLENKKKFLLNKRTSASLPQPKKVKCFQCQTNFYIKFVIPRQDYSQKNNWDYWTGQKKKQKICNTCLKTLYYNKPVYWKTVTDLKKRNLLKSYIHVGHLT